jgi:hypothetical protein
MQGPSPTTPVFVACAFKDVAAAESAVRSLLASGVAPADVAIGAAGSARLIAGQLAHDLGVRDDVDPDDPLAGAPGLASAAIGASSINRGAVIGALVGVLAGFALAFIPNVHVIAVDAHYHTLATVLLCFIVGSLAGATLGSALAPQRSTHAAFRIVDEIEHHGFAVVATLDSATAPAASELLTVGGGLHVMSVSGAE